MTTTAATASSGPVIDLTTVLSLLAAAGLLVTAYLSSLALLPARSSTRTRVLYVWHLFDALTHFIFEGSFLYNCFFTYRFLPAAAQSSSLAGATGADVLLLTAPGVHFLGQRDRLYGSAYGAGPTAKLWQEYAKADKRWGGADLGVVSLELLTVFIGGPLALYVCELLRRGAGDGFQGRIGGKVAFWMVVLATGELYGGFMTFAPEWLTGNPNLDTSNFLYLWVYLVFFNMLWVFFPFWILRESYKSLTASVADSRAPATKKEL